ncbi:MAG: hypothetical protein HY272_13875 [Gammaproteobacteria bacterium]|nr:hypothetical protein [Gammaproteobacteria bacterium]
MMVQGVCGLWLASCGTAPAAQFLGPVESSGYLGYNYRSLKESTGDSDVSNQLAANLNLSTYFWEPYLATTDLSLTLTQDSITAQTGSTSSTNNASIATADWGLDVMPQSHAPFNLHVQKSDSRVNRQETGGTPITFVGQDYSSTSVGLRQSYLPENGGRYQARYDYRTWDSVATGKYDDQTLGFDADWRKPQQHMLARGTYETTQHSVAGRENKNTIVDLSHFYTPVSHFRLDSKVSAYQYDRSFLDPTSQDTRLSRTDITQLSSFAFWRPVNSPFTVSGGMRLMTLDGSQGTVATNDQTQVAANAGLFYQMTNNLRLDSSFASTFNYTAGTTSEDHRQHVGAQYQTDWGQVLGGMWQGYGNVSWDHQAVPTDDYTYGGVQAGHNLSWNWYPQEKSNATDSVRLSAGQAVSYDYSGAAATTRATVPRLDHTASLGYYQTAWQGTTLAQATVSDSRDFVDSHDYRQLANVQLNRTQEFGRRTSLTGNISMQWVKYTYSTVVTRTTSTTGQLRLEHLQMFGVPRLRFISDYIISRISIEGAIDRTDWENALFYSIGMLDTSLSLRLTDTDGTDYDLLYFRVMRRF